MELYISSIRTNRAIFSMIALFILIELLCSSVRRLPPNSAYGVAVFEGSPIRYNIATREATVSCSTLFCDFASGPVVALWSKSVRPRGALNTLNF